MPTVLVTDAEERSALAITRSLGKAGYRVELCSATPRPLAGGSRFAAASHRVPSPLDDPKIFADAVLRVVEGSDVRVLLPISDASLLALLPRRDKMKDALVPFGDTSSFRALSDKRRVTEEAAELGLAIPRQVVLEDPGHERPPLDLGWPVVVKPARSVVGERSGRRKCAVRYAHTGDALHGLLDEIDRGAYPVLLQEYVEGDGVGVFLLRWDGETRAVFGHRRLREKPPSGGVSVYRESVEVERDLLRRCERLLARFEWEGVSMMEFKQQGMSGPPYLMEVNPRFWGSLQLALDAGVDFPRLLVEAALGSGPSPPPGYRWGVRSRWWWGDFDQLVARIRGAGKARAANASRDRIRALMEFLVLWRPGDRAEVFRLRDPVPFVRETLERLTAPFRGS